MPDLPIALAFKKRFVLPVPLQPGEVLKDRYIIVKIIGRGGMGSIYLADDNRLTGRQCAVKEVQQDSSVPDDLLNQGREQFYREASVLARLDHPNLPKVSDYFSDTDRDYLVMDYIPGEDLKTLMDNARREGKFLPLDDVLSWAVQIADALEYLHGQTPPVIHRDIKPSNVKLTPQGLIKLVDFGLVKQMVPEELTITVIQGRGTALYTPLEQYGGDQGHTDVRSDIYAFGATIYHLVTNSAPAEAKQRFLRPDSLQDPRVLNPNIPASVSQAILWAMNLHPDGRPDNVSEFKAGLAGERFERMNGSSTNASMLQWTRDLVSNPVDRGLAAAALFLTLMAVLGSFL